MKSLFSILINITLILPSSQALTLATSEKTLDHLLNMYHYRALEDKAFNSGTPKEQEEAYEDSYSHQTAFRKLWEGAEEKGRKTLDTLLHAVHDAQRAHQLYDQKKPFNSSLKLTDAVLDTLSKNPVKVDLDRKTILGVKSPAPLAETVCNPVKLIGASTEVTSEWKKEHSKRLIQTQMDFLNGYQRKDLTAFRPRLKLITYNSQHVGYIDLTTRIKKASVTPIFIAPQYQGLRIGYYVLEILKKEHEKLRAVIDVLNVPSQRLFESAGFKVTGEEIGHLFPAYIYEFIAKPL